MYGKSYAPFFDARRRAPAPMDMPCTSVVCWPAPRPVRVNLCVPTRGKPTHLAEFVGETAGNAMLPDTRIVIGCDDDDAPLFAPPGLVDNTDQIIWSVAPREDALGAKYNRCAAAYDADLYVMGVDDVAIATPGWDRILAEIAGEAPDGIAFIYFGREPHGEDLPSMIAVTKRAIEIVGFCPPFFPFWWNNTWVDEIAQMCGRVVRAPIETRYPTEFPEPARRDVAYWARFFEATRVLREQAADRLIAASDDSNLRRRQLAELRAPLLEQLAARGACLRDEAFAAAMVRVQAPLDDRHRRLRDRADGLLHILNAAAAA
jgi:hypothetical protein